MEGNRPVAIRDYPLGCVRLLGRPGNSNSSRRSLGASNDELAAPLIDFQEDADPLNARAQFLERRRIFSVLMEYYEKLQDRGELIGFRPDLAAMKQMNDEKISFDYQQLGHVPGIEVGDTFRYRSEMFVVGLHRRGQDGICWIGEGDKKIASSVVSSGGYEDDVDNGETLYYSGQGGNDYRGDKRQTEDQKPIRGNLALLNSYYCQGEVRVIRGRDQGSIWNKLYSYDGLYTVKSFSHDKGASGHKVYQFQLQRVANQPPLKT